MCISLDPLCWRFGWSLVVTGFLSGALLGLFFLRPDFLGGYGSPERRLLRLGHIACTALGILALLYGLMPWAEPGGSLAGTGRMLFLAGGVAMPLVCFASAWRRSLRHAFAVPVLLLVAGVLCALGGMAT